MKVNRRIKDDVVRDVYEIGHEEYGILTYIEYVNESGRVIDEELRDHEGHSIEDPVLLEEIHEAVDAFVEAQDD